MPQILLTNDDGVDAPGLRMLAEALASLGKVHVVAPSTETSGASHSLTLHRTMRVEPIEFPGAASARFVTGTPADCVKLALADLLGQKPEAVVAGINLGRNTGMNLFYSGTVAAALEGAFAGIPSLSVSIATFDRAEAFFGTAAGAARRVLERMLSRFPGRGLALNLNVPNFPATGLQGWTLARQELRPFRDDFERREEPPGHLYDWACATLELSELSPDHPFHFPGPFPTDEEALAQGYVTLTPLRLDFTSNEAFDSLGDFV